MCVCVCPVCKGSPLGELYRCVEERIRVKVHIRTFKGLRGVCSGFVVAFDKFWNMVRTPGPAATSSRRRPRLTCCCCCFLPPQAMVDVDETYREPLLGEAFHHEKALTISRVGLAFFLLVSPLSSFSHSLSQKYCFH